MVREKRLVTLPLKHRDSADRIRSIRLSNPLSGVLVARCVGMPDNRFLAIKNTKASIQIAQDGRGEPDNGFLERIERIIKQCDGLETI